MPTPEPYTTIGPVPQDGTFDFTGILTGKDGVTPLPALAIQTLTLTLSDVKTGGIINGRDQTNVLNLNGVTYDNTGGTAALEWVPLPADNPFVGVNPSVEDGALELHQAIFEWTWSDGSRILSSQRKVFINVERYSANDTPIEPGVGSDPVTLQFLGTNGTPLAGADVWVTSDSLGRTRVAGVLQTDAQGNVRFMLTNLSTYYVWLQHPQFQINGEAFTAQVDV